MTLQTTLAFWAVLLQLAWAEDESVGGHPPHYDDDDSSSNDDVMDTLDYLFYEYSTYMIVLGLAVCLVACIGGMCSYKIYCRTARGASLYNAITGNHAAEIKAKFKQRTSKGGKNQGKGAPSGLVVDDEYDAMERASTVSTSSVDNSNVPIFLRGTKAAETYASTPAPAAPAASSSRLSAAEDGVIAKVAKPKRYKTKTSTKAPSHGGEGKTKKSSSTRSTSGGAKKGRKSSGGSSSRSSGGSNIAF